jgi:diguanylate cyclase (GGDEF)-like protein/PAS domain S-box-containing protein
MAVIRSARLPFGGWWRFTSFGCAFALAAVTFIAWMQFQLGGAALTNSIDDIGEAVAAGIAAASCGLAGMRTQGRLRRAWFLLAASAASWCLGEIFWSVSEVGLGITPVSPSPADIGFLAAIPLAIAGITSFASTARGTSTGLRLWLDRAIVSLSLLYVGWELGLGSVFSGSDTQFASRVVNVAYPVGDILIGTTLLLAIRRATDETQGRLTLLLGGLAANALADSAFIYANVGPYGYVLDAGWVVGYLMLALAALWPSGRSDRNTEHKPIDIWQLTLPWLAVLAGGLTAVVVAAVEGRPMDVFATVLAGAVIALLMASQVMAHQESLVLLIKSRLSATTLNDVIVHAPLGMVRIGPDLKVIEANPSFCAMVGTTADEAMGGPIGRFFPLEEMALVGDELKRLSGPTVDSIEIETQGIRTDDSTIWLHWTATAVDNRSGDLDYYLIMFEDVSERRSTEDALKAAYAELEGLVVQRTVELRSANERLSTEAISDPLTGLYNRRYLQDFVARELSRTRRGGTKIVFAMIDVDHFKRINDSLGHDAGDEVLRGLSAYLRAQIRHEDLAFRYGGEEFLLVLPCATFDGVATRIDQICEQIKHVVMEHLHHPMDPVTLSIGVAIFPDHGDSADAVISCADAALYLAKKGGRNRVVYHAGPVPTSPLVPVAR